MVSDCSARPGQRGFEAFWSTSVRSRERTSIGRLIILISRSSWRFTSEIRIPPNGRPISSYDGLRGMFERNKREQIRAAKKASLPFVGVLARTNSDVDFGADLVAGAMLVISPFGCH